MAESEDPEDEITRALYVVQSMIDISADRLEGLRTQCSTSAVLTQQEIRTLEVFLVLHIKNTKMFGPTLIFLFFDIF